MLHVLRLEYTESEEAAGPHIKDHVEFLDRHHAAGTFLVSGQTVPSEHGGLIIAAGVDRATAEKIADDDPFVRAGVGRYTITTIVPGRAHPRLTELLAPDGP